MALEEGFTKTLVAARKGDEQAVVALYRHLHPRVLRYLRGHEPSEAEDLASEVWLDVARGLHRFEGGEADFSGFVFTIARRRLFDFRRHCARRPAHPVAPEALAAIAGAEDAAHDATSRFDLQAALDCIASLPPDQAEVVLLRVLADLDVERVAAIVGKRPGAVRALQHRALRRLARQLSREPVTR